MLLRDGNFTFTRPFLLLVKVTIDKCVNVLERSWKDELSDMFIRSLSKTSRAVLLRLLIFQIQVVIIKNLFLVNIHKNVNILFLFIKFVTSL